MALRNAIPFLRTRLPTLSQVCYNGGQVGEFGSGAGHGGGTGGSIRDAGGAFGKMEAVHEEQYFRKMQAKQLKKLKEHLDEEISYHEEQIQRHQEAISRHKSRMDEIHEDDKK